MSVITTTNPIDSASWIWCDQDTERLNQYALFRRSFELPQAHGSVWVCACADMRYWLYVNGQRVGFGPGRYHDQFPQYDTHDITRFVRQGDNLIAFKVHSIGPVEQLSSFIPVRGALIASLDWTGGALVTNATWRTIRETAYSSDTPRFCGHQSFIECFDARLAQHGWEQPAFDDTTWSLAYEIPTDSLAPWEKLVPRAIPNLTLIPRTPCRVIETGLSTPLPKFDVMNMETLATMLETAQRSDSTGAVRLDTGTLLPAIFRAPADARSAAYAVLDFAENSAGYLVFDLEGEPGTIIDFGYGESFADGVVNCNCQTVRYCDRIILSGRPLSHQLMFPKCLRYLLVEVRRGNATLKAVRQDLSTYPVEWRGSFTCSGEPVLSRVWQIGAHTVQLCMEDIYMDTPRRERAGWLGDLLPEALAAYYTFGETELARHSLELFMLSQQSEGYISGRYPGRKIGNMPTWSACYSMALADYVRFSGDREFPRKLWPGVCRLTEWFERQRQSNDLLIVLPSKLSDRDKVRHGGYIFIDWAPEMRDGAVTVMNMCYYRYLLDAAWLAEQIGESSDALFLNSLATRSKLAIQKLLFEERRGVYVNCRDENGLCRQAGMQENVLALLWDLATPEQSLRIIAALTPSDAAFPLYENPDPNNWAAMGNGEIQWPHESLVPMGSPFFGYFAYGALFEIGRATAALNNIRAHYGALLAQGATTVWEEWSGVSSQSHGWGAAPTVFAMKYVLGVEPLEPGFETFSVLPCFGDLRQASGRVPTPRGTIAVAWQRTEHEAKMMISVPQGTCAHAGLPLNQDSATLHVNGAKHAPEIIQLRRGKYAACKLVPGTHELCLFY